MSQEKVYKYIAFISYRHLKPDSDVAQAIHTMIETFKIPKEHQSEQKYRVFRDREELTTKSLSGSLDEALRESKFLIVICSKQLPYSEWCNREVQTFKELHGVERIIPVLIEGEPHESFPKALLDDQDILAAELRPNEVMNSNFVGYKQLSETNPSKLDQLTKESLKLLKNEKYRIMAAILGITFGDLKQRDKERKQRQQLMISTVVSAALLIFGVFMFNAYRNENIAKRQTIQDKSQMMLDTSKSYLQEGDILKSLLVANQAIDAVDESMEAYPSLISQHYGLLNDSLNQNNPSMLTIVDTNNRFTFLDIHPDGTQFIAGLNNDSVGLWDIKTGSLIKSVSHHSLQVKLVDYSNGGDYFASGGFDDVLNVFDSKSLELISSIKTPGNIMLLMYSKDDKVINVIYDTMSEYVYQQYDSKNLTEIGSSIKLNNNIKRVVINPENTIMIVNYEFAKDDQSLIKYDLVNFRSIHNYPESISIVKDFDDNDTEMKNKYKDVRMSQDGKSVFTISDRKLIRIDIDSDKIMMELDADLYGENLISALTSDDQFIYLVNGKSIRKFNLETTELILDLFTDTETITDIKLSKDNQVLLFNTQGGEIGVLKEDKRVEMVQNDLPLNSEYVYITKDGSHGLALSLLNQDIKIVELNPQTNSIELDGQIVGYSNNSEYYLIYKDETLTLMKSKTHEKVKEINDPILELRGGYLFDGHFFSITNDGHYLMNISRDTQDPFIYVFDLETNKVIKQSDFGLSSFNLDFTSDSKHYFYNTSVNEIMLVSIEDAQEQSIIIQPGFVRGLMVSDDNENLVVSYTEGNSIIYKISDSTIIGEVSGQVIHISKDEGGIHLLSIYNNLATWTTNFEVTKELNLDSRRAEGGFTLSDINRFNENSNTLLSQKSIDDHHYTFLIDLNSGDLIKSFTTLNTSFKSKAFQDRSGNQLILDNYVTFIAKGELSFDGLGNDYDFNAMIVAYQIDEYEALVEKAKNKIENVELNDGNLKD